MSFHNWYQSIYPITVDIGTFELLEKAWEQSAIEDREANGWQPIETAPKDGTSLLGYWLGGKHECSIHTTKFHCGRWWATNEDYQHSTPSYWMPLPVAPKDEVGELISKLHPSLQSVALSELKRMNDKEVSK